MIRCPTASATGGGKALPIWRQAFVFLPVMRQESGNPWSRAIMRGVRRGDPSKSGPGASSAIVFPVTFIAAHAFRARVGPRSGPPCFFDPAHGPSTRNVTWAPPGGAPREVPACALDAARVTSGADPHIRMVQQGYQAVPYWQDQGHAAYARGYYEPYGLDPVVQGLAKGALLFGGFSLLMGLLDD